MSVLSLALRIAAPLPNLEGFERYLFLGPHPDDIEIGAGATAAKLAAVGKSVRFVICTDGRYGTDNAPAGTEPMELRETRKAEAIASAKRLGVEDVRFLDFCDGGFYDLDELKRAVAAQIGEYRPQVVFAPDPCVDSECHIDHLNVGQCARYLSELAPNPGIMERLGAKSAEVQALAFYMTARPNRYVKTTGYLKAQDEALFTCHKSQYPDGCADIGSIRAYLKLRSISFGLRSFKGRAEGFRVLGRTQMHCLPEAGE